MADFGQEQTAGGTVGMLLAFYDPAILLDRCVGNQFTRKLMAIDKQSKVWIVASVGPLFAMAILSLLTHLFRRWNPEFLAPTYPVEYALALGVGVVSIDTLSISWYQKAFVLALYIPLEVLALLVFSITFGCLAFGNCL